ncbi:MAG: hypothetical protein VB934_06985 [Polyangiaceae bacterium]
MADDKKEILKSTVRLRADATGSGGERAVSAASATTPVVDGEASHEGAPAVVLELAVGCTRFVATVAKVQLDFGPDTLSILDHYVRESRDAIKERPESLALTARSIGAYLGELVRRRHRCWWRLDESDPSAWRLEFRDMLLAVYPVQIAYTVLTQDRDEDPFCGFEIEPEAREALLSRLGELPPVSEDEYFCPSTHFDVLEMAIDTLIKMAPADPSRQRTYSPVDYE